MRKDHSIAGTTVLQTTLEDADKKQFFFDGKTNPVVLMFFSLLLCIFVLLPYP